ncbi:MAG: hypothetical protein HZA54_16645 [Planctomycetes bacterium]|nr:hypothetical protein [Planctomycetota bacterium]
MTLRAPRNAPPAHQRRHGMALLLALAALGLLSVLGLTFTAVATTEARISAAYLDLAHARMGAMAGIEAATGRLRADAGTSVTSDPNAEWRYGGGPLESTTAPSYYSGTAFGFAYSGTTGGTHRPLGDQYVLLIYDTGAQLCLNLPVPGLAAMLDTLGRAIRDDLTARGLPAVDPIAGRGAAIVALKAAAPGGMIPDKDSLRTVLGAADALAVEPFLCVRAWTDARTVAPTATPLPEGMPGFVVEPRSPINVNLAPKPVLVAVLSGVRGPIGPGISYATASAVADEILARRGSRLPGQGPFVSWPDFYAFVRGLAARPAIGLSPDDAEALLANADPNFHPRRLNPERVIATPIDKLELRARTTEFGFRECGLYEVTALGRVLGADARPIASAKATALVEVFRLLVHTVQGEFEARRASSPTENATTWPAPQPRAGGTPATWAGHVQLQTDTPARAPLTPTAPFQALLRDGLAAEVAPGPPAPDTDQEAGPDPARAGGDLVSDGLFFADNRAELTGWTSRGNADPVTGGFEFWMKLDERAAALPITVALLTFPETSEIGVQHRIRAGISGGTLTVESTRVAYVSAGYGTDPERRACPIPYAFEETTHLAVLPGLGQGHEWHRVAVSWTDGTRQALAVDGRRGLPVSLTPSGPGVAFLGWPPYRDRLVVGGEDTLARGREVSPATLDDFRLYAAAPLPTWLLFSPSRFEDAALAYAGRFESAFDPVPGVIRLLGVSWTEWTPASYNGVPLLNAPGAIDLGLDVGGGLVTVAGPTPGTLLRALGLGVEVRNRSVRYEIRFRHNPLVLPLNVTPILDDLTIAYDPGVVRFLDYHWVYDG